MGLEVFVFNIDPEQALCNRQTALDILARDAIDPSNLSVVEYPDHGGLAEIYGLEEDEDDEVHNLMFAHFGGRTLLSRIYELADRTDGFIYWTDVAESGIDMGVTKEALLGQIPEELTRDGKAVVIRDVEHLNELMGGHKMQPAAVAACS